MKVKLAIGRTDGTITSVGVSLRGVNLTVGQMPFLGIEGRVKALRAVNALLWMLQGSPDAVVDEADIKTVREMLEKQLEALAEVKSEVPD